MRLHSPLELERLAWPLGTSDVECVRALSARVIDDLGIGVPPVDLEMVASYVDIASVTRVAGLEVAGCLIPSTDGESVIQVRAEDSYSRQRFTIGHEIGHTFFPGFALRPQYRCSPSPTVIPSRDIEALCDVAASELLLPSRLLTEHLQGSRPTLDVIEQMSEDFQASLAACASKVASVCDHPVAVLTFEVRTKPSEAGTNAPPSLRLQTAVSHGPGWPFFPPHKSADPTDVFSRALDGEVVHEPTITLRGLTKMPITCEVHAKLYPYATSRSLQPRVIALLVRS